MNQAVVCIAPDVLEAELEVQTLRQAGFATDDISVLWPDLAGAQELGYEHHTKAPEGIAWGVLFGGLVGGVTAYLNCTGVLWTPWAANLTNAGAVLATLSGIAVGGMVGFLLGLFIGLALPEYEAKKYERKIKIGSTLLAVHTDSADEVKIAESALKKTSAFGIRHIEETHRCKPKCTVTGDKDMAKTTTTLSLLVLLAACSVPYAMAAEPVQVSPSATKDEQKATMPPDVTTPKALDPVTPAAEKTVTTTEKTSTAVVKTKRHKAKSGCKNASNCK